MAEQYVKAEIITPHADGATIFGKLFNSFVLMAIRVLIIWWAVAAWFPELGLTYWQLILPVYAIRMLTGNVAFTPRMLRKTK